jgi:hypothetical protein
MMHQNMGLDTYLEKKRKTLVFVRDREHVHHIVMHIKCMAFHLEGGLFGTHLNLYLGT